MNQTHIPTICKMQNHGSAYLFVLGAISLCLVFLSVSLRNTVDNSRLQASVKTRLLIDQDLISCATAILNRLKIHDWKKQYQHIQEPISLNQSICEHSLSEQKEGNFLFDLNIQTEKWQQKGEFKVFYEDNYNDRTWNSQLSQKELIPKEAKNE